jgi:hypothetical protein
MKRAAPVLALLLLAPWVREFLLGNISGRQLPALLILALLCGCGALLIREMTRRTSRCSIRRVTRSVGPETSRSRSSRSQLSLSHAAGSGP